MEDSIYIIFKYMTESITKKIDDKLYNDSDNINKIYNELLIRNTVMNIMSPHVISIINKNKI
jgi:hypothetical protein